MSCQEFVTVKVEDDALCTRTPLNVVGATTLTGYRVLDTVTDSNCIFVDGKNGNDGDPGTESDPKATIAGAISALGTKRYIQIQSDDLAYEVEPETFPNENAGNRLKIQAKDGVKPQLYMKVASNSKLTLPPKPTSYRGYAIIKGWNGYIYNCRYNSVSGDVDLYRWNGTTNSSVAAAVATLDFTNIWSGIQYRSYYTDTQAYLGRQESDVSAVFALQNKANTAGIYKAESSGTLPDYTGALQSGSGACDFIVGNINSPPEGVFDFCPGVTAYTSKGTPPVIGNGETFFWLQAQSIFPPTDNELYGAFTNLSSFTSYRITLGSNPYCLEQFYRKVYCGTNAGVYAVSLQQGGLSATVLSQFESTSWVLQGTSGSNFRSLKAFYWNRGLPLDGRDRLYAGCENGDLYEYNPNSDQWSLVKNLGVSIDKIEVAHVEGLYRVMYFITRGDDALYRYDIDNDILDLHISNGVDNLAYLNNALSLASHGFYYADGWDIHKKYEDMVLPYPVDFNGLVFSPEDTQHSGFRGVALSTGKYHSFLWCDLLTPNGKYYNLNSASVAYYLRVLNCTLSDSLYGILTLKDEEWDEADNFRCNIKIKNNNFYNITRLGIAGHYYGNFNGGAAAGLRDMGIRNNNFVAVNNAISYANSSSPATNSQLYVSENNFLNCSGFLVKSFFNSATIKNNVAYRYNDSYINCIQLDAYPSVYQHPLFKDIMDNPYDLELQAECEGYLFSSPSVRTPYSGTSNAYIYASDISRANRALDIIDLAGYDMYSILISYFGSGTNLLVQGSTDTVGWTTIQTVLPGSTPSGTLIEVNSIYRYFRIYLTGLWEDLSITLNFQDIGAHNVERPPNAVYDTLAEISLQYNPSTMEFGVRKSDEQQLSNFRGDNFLLARPRQTASLSFGWESDSFQGWDDPYEYLYLYGLHNKKLRFYFANLQYTGDISSPNSAVLALRSPSSSATYANARVWLSANGYDVDAKYLLLRNYSSTPGDEGTYEWHFLQWKGWWVTISGSTSGSVNYDGTYKVLYSDQYYLWLDFSDTGTYNSLVEFEIEYFRGILGTASIAASKTFLRMEGRSDEIPLRIDRIEILEA